MNPVINHFNLQDIRLKVNELADGIKKLQEKDSFPVESLQITQDLVRDLAPRLESITAQYEQIKVEGILIKKRIGDFEFIFNDVLLLLKFTRIILYVSMFNLGALAWLIVRHFY